MANYTSVTASNICDAAGNKLASGTVSFQATDAANQPLNFQVGGGGQVVTTPATAAIVAGVIAGGFQVADSANTSPAGILYRITITDTTLNRVVVTYSLVTVTGTTFNLDNFSQTGAAVLPPVGGSVNGPLTVNGNLNVTGSYGTIKAQKIEGVLYADQFPGADIGAQVNAALAFAGSPCKVIVSTPGVLSTGISFPGPGYTLEFAPGTYSASSRILVNHRDTRILGNGASIQYTNTGNGAFFLEIGKISNYDGGTATTVNGSATVNWTSGSLFDFDLGDRVLINGTEYNIAGSTPTVLTLASPAVGNFTGSYFGIINPENFVLLNSNVVVRDLQISYTGGGSPTSNGAFTTSGLIWGIFDNIFIRDFTTGTAMQLLGTQSAAFYNTRIFNCKNGIHIMPTGGVGQNVSNINYFYNLDITAGTAGGISFNVEAGNNYNQVYGAVFENSLSDQTAVLAGFGTLLSGIWFEGNGSTTALVDCAVTGNQTTIRDCFFDGTIGGTGVSFATNTINGCLENCQFFGGAGSGYATAYVITGTAKTQVRNVSTGGSGTEATTFGGDVISTNGAFISGALAGSIVIRNGAAIYAASNANNALVNLIAADVNNAVILDSLGNGTKVGSGGTSQLTAGKFIVTTAAPTVSAGQVGLGSTHATTVGAAGGATALPATPLGYIIANVDGTQVKIPYYNN